MRTPTKKWIVRPNLPCAYTWMARIAPSFGRYKLVCTYKSLRRAQKADIFFECVLIFLHIITRDIKNTPLVELGLGQQRLGSSENLLEPTWESERSSSVSLAYKTSSGKGGGRPEHLLWALYLMKIHFKQDPGSWVIGASCKAVQLKTNRKWVWAFIKAIAKLIDLVVSIYIIVFIGTCLFIFV